METRVKMLEAQIELTQAAMNQEYNKIKEQAEQVIQSMIVLPHDAVLQRCFIRTGFKNNMEINFELGFWNTEEGRVDFGSDVWCEFDSSTEELRVNYGTCGSYSKKDAYQIRRVQLVADIWSKIHELEAKLLLIAKEDAQEYRRLENELYDYQHELEKIHKQQQEAKLLNIEKSLNIGDALEYIDDVRPSYRLFYAYAETWKIHRICEKTIKIKGEHTQIVKQLDKKQLINLIRDQKIQVVRGVE